MGRGLFTEPETPRRDAVSTIKSELKRAMHPDSPFRALAKASRLLYN